MCCFWSPGCSVWFRLNTCHPWMNNPWTGLECHWLKPWRQCQILLLWEVLKWECWWLPKFVGQPYCLVQQFPTLGPPRYWCCPKFPICQIVCWHGVEDFVVLWTYKPMLVWGHHTNTCFVWLPSVLSGHNTIWCCWSRQLPPILIAGSDQRLVAC